NPAGDQRSEPGGRSVHVHRSCAAVGLERVRTDVRHDDWCVHDLGERRRYDRQPALKLTECCDIGGGRYRPPPMRFGALAAAVTVCVSPPVSIWSAPTPATPDLHVESTACTTPSALVRDLRWMIADGARSPIT